MLVKASTIAPESLVVLLLKPLEVVGAVLMLVDDSMSIQNPLSPVDRIVPLRASLSCNDDAESQPTYQAVGLDHMIVAHCSYRYVPVGRLPVSLTF